MKRPDYQPMLRADISGVIAMLFVISILVGAVGLTLRCCVGEGPSHSHHIHRDDLGSTTHYDVLYGTGSSGDPLRTTP